MNLSKPEADVFIPDGLPLEEALGRTTHLGVGAHQDDLEFMSLHGILECFDRADRWYGGVVITNGGGSARTGPYADYSDRQMQGVRVQEQREAAALGRYGSQIQLMFASSEVKDPGNRAPYDDLKTIVELTRPEVVYLHNPADKHDTHVACCTRSIAALRSLPAEGRPKKVYGCEVWRDLDWLIDADKQALPLEDPGGLGPRLNELFASQIVGGKRYDLAVQGRQVANATFHQSHAVDQHQALSFAMDLTPLVNDSTLDICEFTLAHLRRTTEDVADRLRRMLPVI
jgi:LmbE family N-acetylglucosaminyl deacetylase